MQSKKGGQAGTTVFIEHVIVMDVLYLYEFNVKSLHTKKILSGEIVLYPIILV